jgi:hypothetical protein
MRSSVVCLNKNWNNYYFNAYFTELFRWKLVIIWRMLHIVANVQPKLFLNIVH